MSIRGKLVKSIDKELPKILEQWDKSPKEHTDLMAIMQKIDGLIDLANPYRHKLWGYIIFAIIYFLIFFALLTALLQEALPTRGDTVMFLGLVFSGIFTFLYYRNSWLNDTLAITEYTVVLQRLTTRIQNDFLHKTTIDKREKNE
ncbi:hypothetical protein A9K75_07840 [Campylobacter fetus subsp. testudinum]|uniref:hypothetical protein n=1 Tax=Campylobacter fetus TaxID=196 RepID=UPI000818A009|nr:hypothetical protein [Campylobacter fetus]OCR99228.1 hypothetical protein A9K75_07840 [Campylobacter fetus subsp. testudinum]